LPKESKNVGGQAYPSWAEAKAKFMAHTNKVKPKIIEDNNNDYTMSTFDELPIEHCQAYEIYSRKNMKRNIYRSFFQISKKIDNTKLPQLEKSSPLFLTMIKLSPPLN
jgi:hypothetical protein